jgi:predicted PhzF superfamily epimerase YddE/YHI9
MVTARAGPDLLASGVDFVSRFFAPAVGVDEDPVTGSAHCCLGPWWANRLGTTDLVGRQVSDRGGTVGVRVRSDRVLLAGKAVTILQGELVAERIRS